MKARLVLVGMLVSMLAPLAARPAMAADTSYTFNLTGPSTAMAPSGPFAGDTIRTTGAGSFDTGAATIVASGSFTHTKADGSVFARGTWVATSFTGFTAFGGPNPGIQGGVLELVATLYPTGEPPVPDVPITVTCEVNSPGGFEEGTAVGDFTEKTAGETLFHLSS